MAIPIAIVPSTAESKKDIKQHLEQARIQHAAAILASYELLQQMQDHGLLDILRGALGAGDAIISKLATAANKEESINAVRNLISLSRILGSVDPDLLHRVAEEIISLKRADKHEPKSGIWAALKAFASKDSRRALVGTAAFVQAFGRALASNKET